jgi:general secretion pathway protein A
VYTEFFGLNEKPFSITPDPRYLYLSRRHADALAHLIYGISESGGFIQLTGEVGTGKTTLIRSVLEQLPEKAEIALMLNPQLSSREFLENICEELRMPLPSEKASVRELIAALNSHLLKAHAEGRRIVLIVDEAQTLGPELLEQVRLLTNLETATQKLLQIILIGQPELRDLLKRSEMRQIAQRITGRFHLEPLSKSETAQYVRHRLRVAGCHTAIFSTGALRELYRRSKGIPRLINVVADRALLAAYTRDRTRVDGALVRRAAAEVFGRRLLPYSWPWAAAAAGAAAIALGAMGVYGGWLGARGSGELPPAAEVSRPAPAETLAAPANRAEAILAAAPLRNEVAAMATSPSPRLEHLLTDPAFTTDTDSAFVALFELWGARYQRGRGDPCLQAAEQRLRCLFRPQGSIGGLRNLNRPAILTLVDAAGKAHDIVVAKLGYADVKVVAGERSAEVELSDLTHYWFGDHLILWRPPTTESKALAPGMQGVDIIWLRESLARIRGEPLPAEPSALYDARLEAEVRRYQREKMLTVDGIVGEMTQLALMSDLGQPERPTLRGDY